MKVLSKAEMKAVLGGFAQVTCTMYMAPSCGGGYSESGCFSDLDTCQNQGDATCESPQYYACCNDVSCKYT